MIQRKFQKGILMGTTNMQAAEMMGLYPSMTAKKKPATKAIPKPMPMRGERTAKNMAKKAKK
jgi:hypothetical protein